MPPEPDLPSIYRSEFSYVWKTLRRLGAPSADIEDLAHDVFVVAHRHLGDYDPTRPLRPWLFGIAVRVVSDHRRVGRNSREIPGEIAEAVDATPSVQDRLEDREARALLMRALDELDLEQRAVLVMHDLDELPVPEIAAALSIPLNTAYSRLRLARAAVSAWVARFSAREKTP
ncbi:MAG: sigma-70 family RNA polymerase sigma factor [Deltaproteobacteria bacterium]|nr:sigma-70 family RNA polymerase sigma factor [Deltaproteobacteria bacterium]